MRQSLWQPKKYEDYTGMTVQKIHTHLVHSNLVLDRKVGTTIRLVKTEKAIQSTKKPETHDLTEHDTY